MHFLSLIDTWNQNHLPELGRILRRLTAWRRSRAFAPSGPPSTGSGKRCVRWPITPIGGWAASVEPVLGGDPRRGEVAAGRAGAHPSPGCARAASALNL